MRISILSNEFTVPITCHPILLNERDESSPQVMKPFSYNEAEKARLT
jgi:hypothetical protein